MLDNYSTIKDAAETLGLRYHTLYRRIVRQHVPTIRVGRVHLLDNTQIARWSSQDTGTLETDVH